MKNNDQEKQNVPEKLDDKQLENVSGGGGGTYFFPAYITYCPECGRETASSSDSRHTYTCQSCGCKWNE